MVGCDGSERGENRALRNRETANRSKKLADIGESLAVELLSDQGFANIKDLNKIRKNHPFADIYAERNGEKFWISVKARNKYEENGKINYCYYIRKGERDLAIQLEQKYPGTQAACLGISFVVSQNSCRDGEPTNSYSCYFTKLTTIANLPGIRMTPDWLPNYDCLAKDKIVPPKYDVSDCENVFARRISGNR